MNQEVFAAARHCSDWRDSKNEQCSASDSFPRISPWRQLFQMALRNLRTAETMQTQMIGYLYDATPLHPLPAIRLQSVSRGHVTGR